jgi:serine/threonine-protein kinase
LNDAESVAEAERELANLRDTDPAMVAIDARLSAILRGDQQLKDIPQRLQLARRAYEKGFHAASAKLWAEAFEADPKISESRNPQNRYNAAIAAALAGCGQGKDEPAPDDFAKSKLRGQALGWLQAELAAWSKMVESASPLMKASIAQTLAHWKQDPDLAGIRDEASLAKLPEPEREAFRLLWADVEALRVKAGGK